MEIIAFGIPLITFAKNYLVFVLLVIFKAIKYVRMEEGIVLMELMVVSLIYCIKTSHAI